MPDFRRLLVEHARDALVVLRPDGVVAFWSRGAQSMFGYDPEEAVGQSLADLIVPEGLREETARRFEATLLSGHSDSSTLRRRKDGSLLEVNTIMRVVTKGTGDGPLLAVSHIELHDERRFRALLESAPDAMILLGEDGRITLVNARTEALFGYTRGELLGQSIEVLVPERYRENHPAHRSGYFGAPKARPMGVGLDLTARRKDGSELAVEISLSPIDPRGGSSVIAAVRDASERKRLEELRRKSRALEEQNLRIEEANRLKSEFLANMSHELRTPLNAIIGFADLMHSGKVGPLAEHHREYLGDILTSSRHLHQLVNDVLDLAKIEAGKVEIRPEAVDLSKAVAEVRDILRGLAGAVRIQCEVDVDPRLSIVVLDPHKLKQVLYNYLSNAIKFSKSDGRVRVHAYPTADLSTLRLDVTDEGIGIRDCDLPKLFVEFQQLDAGPNKHYPGTGLGLAVTKRVVEAQGGRVGVTSVHGQGSTFWVELPLVKSEVVRGG